MKAIKFSPTEAVALTQAIWEVTGRCRDHSCVVSHACLPGWFISYLKNSPDALVLIEYPRGWRVIGGCAFGDKRLFLHMFYTCG